MRLGWLSCLLVCNAWAQTDSRLAPLHQTLQSLHGVGPQFTLAKHQLRDWIESQFDPIENEGDEAKASTRIDAALEKISVEPSNNSQNLFGSLGRVDLKWESGLLIVTAGLGIVCEYDESVYGYKRVDGKWRRVWESEQNDYQKYTPQQIDAVHVWQSYESGKPIGPAYILTLGNEWGCGSAWHPVYYRIWRVDSSASKLLVDQSEGAFLRARTYIVGSIVNSPMHFRGPVDALIEFTQRSVDVGVHNREAVRHFLIEGDRVRRVAPVALSPRDFVDEWLTRPWNESKEWSLSEDLANWHRKLHTDDVFGDFQGDTMHCDPPDLWQVAFMPHDANFNPRPNVYFLVRWTPPYNFALAAIGGDPSPRCTQPNRDADTWRTMFSTQDWRW